MRRLSAGALTLVVAALSWLAMFPQWKPSEHWFPHVYFTHLDLLEIYLREPLPWVLGGALLAIALAWPWASRLVRTLLTVGLASWGLTYAALAFTPAQEALLFQSPSAIHDGIHLDFTQNINGNGCCYVKKPGQPAQFGSFASLFTITRTSGATFVGPDGLIQWANENNIKFSNDLSQNSGTTYWFDQSTGTTTRTAGQADPLGGTQAVKLVGNNSNTWWGQNTGLFEGTGAVPGFPVTWSMWVRADAPVTISMKFTINGGSTTSQNIDVTTAWQRFSQTVVTTIGTGGSGVNVALNVGNGNNIYGWGAQAQRGSIAQELIPTTTAARFDVPRIQYDANGAAMGYLYEGARDNFLLWSEDFTNAVWVNTNTTDASNTAVAPDGNTTADTLTATAANGSLVQNFQGYAVNGGRAFSVYLKRLTGSGDVTLQVGRTGSGVCTVTATWNRCKVSDTVLAGTYAVVANVVTVTAVAHGLNTGEAARFDYTSGTAADFNCASVTVLTADTFTCAQTTADTTGNISLYANVGRIIIATNTDAVYVWGAQAEAVANIATQPTSYFPSTTAGNNRGQEIASRVFGPEYSLVASSSYAKVFIPYTVQTTQGVFSLSATGRNLNFLNSTMGISVRSGATVVLTANGGTAGTYIKVASLYSAVNAAACLDGGTMATGTANAWGSGETAIAVGAVDSGGGSPLNGIIQRIEYYPYRQPDQWCRTITQTGPQSALEWPHYAANDNAVERAA